MSLSRLSDESTRQRSRSGCLTCRHRRVKCDETKPICRKCKGKGRECSWLQQARISYTDRGDSVVGQDERQDEPLGVLDSADTPLVRPEERAWMMADSAFLEPYFPSVDHRLVVRHYLLHSVHLTLAYENPNRFWNPWVDLVVPLALHSRPCARRTSLAREALRAGVLVVGAIHLRYRQDPLDDHGAMRLFNETKRTILNAARAFSAEPAGGIDDACEMMLASFVLLITAGVLSPLDEFQDLSPLIAAFLADVGGLSALLDKCPKDRFSLSRFLAEQLVVRDIYGSLNRPGSAPLLLTQDNIPRLMEAGTWSRNDDEWESFERMFGFSRNVILLAFEYCTLASPPDLAKANELLESLHRVNFVDHAPLHSRTQVGNLCYRYTLRILLLSNVFHAPSSDPRIVEAVEAVIELAQEVLASSPKISWLMWPVRTAILHLPPNDPRAESVVSLAEEFAHHGCFDTRVSLDMIKRHFSA